MVHLVIFDVEGVLLPRKRTLLIDITQQLKGRETLKLLVFGFLYQLKIIPFSSFIKKSYKLFKGSPIDIFYDIYRSTPISKNSREVIRKLREHDIITVLISSGLPQEIVEELKENLNADHAYGIDVVKDEYGLLSGEISGEVIENMGKRKILKRIAEEMRIDYDDIAVVADDSNNLQMLEDCGLFIGFNPEKEVAARTELAITGNDLQQVYNILQGQPHSKNVLTKEMLLRKATHSSGAFTLLLISYFGLFNTQLLIIFMIVLFSLSEYLRLKGKSLPLFTWVTYSMALGVEKTNIVTTPIWYALGVLTTITFFPFRYALIGVLTLTLGDVAASLVGQSIADKHSYPFNKSKSVEGTLAGFLVAVLFCSFFSDPYISVIGCFVGMLVEALPFPFDDNISVPFFSSLASLVFGHYWFGA